MDRKVARIATRLSVAYMLRAAQLASSRVGGDFVLTLVVNAILSANLDYLDFQPQSAGDYDGLEQDVPDELRRPVSVLALSNSLGMAYETTRRHVNKLTKAGICEKVRGGVIVPSRALNTEFDQQAMLENLANIRRMVKLLRAAGVKLD